MPKKKQQNMIGPDFMKRVTPGRKVAKTVKAPKEQLSKFKTGVSSTKRKRRAKTIKSHDLNY